jgi:ABC-type lipoprotein release transport system permease subunit
MTRLSRMAWRNLWRNRRRTLLTLVAIAFGLFLSVLMTAMQDRSFADMIDDAARLGSGHVTVSHPDYREKPSLRKSLPNATALAQQAKEVEGVEHVAVRVSGATMVATAEGSYGAFFVAFDPAEETVDSFYYMDSVVEGEMLQPDDTVGMVLGTRLAANLGAELGDKVVYRLMDKDGEITAGLGRVRGLSSSGSPAVDGGLVILHIEGVREVLGYSPTEATELAVFTADSRDSDVVADRLEQALGQDVAAATWDTISPDLSGFVAMKVGGARFMEAVIMILVAAGIFNTLFVSVMERTREFGIMLAIGWSSGQIFRLVMWESLWLALVGVLLGGAVTGPLYTYLALNPIDLTAAMEGQTQIEVGGVGMSMLLRIGIFPENLAIILALVIGSTLLSGVYPAWKAGNTVPVDSIKLV